MPDTNHPPPDEVELVSLDALQLRPDNPRTHPERQITKLAKSIQRFGFTAPILIDENNQVLAGHGRVAAAQKLSLGKVPCRRLTHMTPAEKRAYVLADNKLALDAGWDVELLANDLLQLDNISFDLSFTGFEPGEIDDLLSAHEAGNTRDKGAAEDEVPTPEETRVVSRPGDIWLLGPHKLACGDAHDPALMGRLMGGEQADMMFTDPPYNVPIDGHVSGLGKARHPEFEMASGEMSDQEFETFLRATLGNGAWHCRDGAIAFVFMDWRHISALIVAGQSVFSELKNLCIWNKTNAGMGSFYRSKHELVAVFKKGRSPHTNTFGLGDKGRYRTNVWSYAGVNSFSSERMDQLSRHPTSKPVELVSDAIRDVSYRGQLVLDMFGGSGTTLIAAQCTGRIARLVEISPAYCDVIIRRWQKYTGKFATREQGGETFEKAEIASEFKGTDND